MAWAYVQTIEGVDLDTYDAVGDALSNETPPGAIFHVAGLYEGKLRVIEVWKSEEAYLRYREERLKPALQTVVGPEAVSSDWPPPSLEPMDVHNLLQPD
jgi:hypothetical protein